MSPRDYNTVEQMEMFGGGFVQALANAARHADSINLNRIKHAFREYWEHYEEMGVEAGIKRRSFKKP